MDNFGIREFASAALALVFVTSFVTLAYDIIKVISGVEPRNRRFITLTGIVILLGVCTYFFAYPNLIKLMPFGDTEASRPGEIPMLPTESPVERPTDAPGPSSGKVAQAGSDVESPRVIVTATPTSAPPTDTPTHTATPPDTPTSTHTPLPTKPPATPTPVPVQALRSLDAVLIPASNFQMGCGNQEPKCDGDGDEVPLRTVYVDAFLIDQFEVTNADYQSCVAGGDCSIPTNTTSRSGHKDNLVDIAYYNVNAYANYPVVWVTWYQAKDYCSWVGGRLPTEAEWEKAARGDEDVRIMPWGNNTSCGIGNVVEDSGDNLCGEVMPAEVGAFSRGVSPYGVYDMAGNVWEWTADIYDLDYYTYAPNANPLGADSGDTRAIRGGAFSSSIQQARVANRGNEPPSGSSYNHGFRCVYTP